MPKDLITVEGTPGVLRPIETDPPHRCSLPALKDKVGERRDIIPNDLARCPDCGRWWKCVYVDDDWTGHHVWTPVRWYHFRSRRLLNARG